MQVILANPRGFCAGVDRAIGIVERALELFGAPIYVRHEVVHNKFVVDGLRAKGAVFVDDLADVPNDATLVFSAHGVSQSVRLEAEQRGLKVFDATCPLVTKVHMEVAKHSQLGRDVILIGHAGHPEVEGTLGQYQRQVSKGDIYLVESLEDVLKLQLDVANEIAFVTQTTLSVDDTVEIIDALRQHFPTIIGPRTDDICYATQNRQDAVKELAATADMVLVVGSKNSSNSNRLCELATKMGVPAYLVDNADEIRQEWLVDKKTIGVTAGASAPESLVAGVINRLRSEGAAIINEAQGRPEKVIFALPKELQ